MELVYKWITLANRHYYMYLNRALAPFGINSSQYLFILNLCRDPGITQDKLPERICVNKSNVARTLAQLEKKGLIRRQVNPGDKRTAAVFPTERARELYPRIMEVIATCSISGLMVMPAPKPATRPWMSTLWKTT